ncbi:hypothetical protein HY628_02860 [Candidatus Uhrbacteria bacterium]|nr:hypothetical protein [Candidatus Uhrbacteria bacterium]
MDLQKTPQHEQMALGAVILGGIVALIFGFSYLARSIENPLRLKPTSYKTPLEREAEGNAELRTKDTDQDGLTDYDELHVWNTSPYLPDSDSDGYSDKTELESGNNPNCPTGRQCGPVEGAGSGEGQGQTSSQPSDFTPGPQTTEISAGLLGLDLLENLPAQELRKLLLEYGVPQKQLDALNDEDLVKLYRDSVAKVQADLEAQAREEESD